jgi:hypothetical protein
MATCKNGAWQAARSALIWEQGVAGSNPAVPTTSTNPLLSRGADGPSLGQPEHAARSQPLHHTLVRGAMSSTQPAPADCHLPRGHLLVLNRSFRRTLEGPRTRAHGPSRSTPTPSGSSPPSAKPKPSRSSPASLSASTSRSSSPTSWPAGSRRQPATVIGGSMPSSSGR